MNSLDKAEKTVEALRRRIGEDQFLFSFARSGGPGGQNVNKVETRVTLTFDLRGSRVLTAVEKELIAAKLAGRMTRAGHLRVVSMRHRTQGANRCAVVERFYELLANALRTHPTRRPTRVTARAKERRLIQKRLSSQRKRFRGRPAANALDD